MSHKTSHIEKAEEYALERVPESERKNWLYLAWVTMGCATTLVQIFLGGFLAFTAGSHMLMLACLFACPLAALIGWGVGHMAYRQGLSSTLLARSHGFGVKGSVLASLIVAFMLIGFMALENALIYNAGITFFALPDLFSIKLTVYLLLSALWVALAAYGFRLMTLLSGLAVCGFVVVIVAIAYIVKRDTGIDWATMISFSSVMPPEVQASMGVTTDMGKWVFCVNVILGSIGPIALFCADIGRYARTSSGIGLASLTGMCTAAVMILVCGFILHAGLPLLAQYYVDSGRAGTLAEASGSIVGSSENVLFAIFYFGGFLGSALMLFALIKVQVVNTYGSALGLANLLDTLLGWRPGHLACIVLANVLNLVLLFGGLLNVFSLFITFLGSICIGMATIMMLDFFLMPRLWPSLKSSPIPGSDTQLFNITGIATLCIAYLLGHFVFIEMIPVEGVCIILISTLLYPPLRRIELHCIAQSHNHKA